MYQTPVSLEPPLSPREYYDEDFWKLECRAVFAHAWHLVGTGSQLARPGQFITLNLLGVPVVVRNFQGELVALRNVCAHRQSLIATTPTGCSESLKCPYHGWEYGPDGRTRKLPGASNFPKFDHKRYCLDKFELDRCGDLVFVRLSKDGPTLREWIGERFERFEAWFSPADHHLTLSRRFEYPANWKIPVENSLESYHIPCVHPHTFHSDPAEPGSTHHFFDTGSSFEADFFAPRMVDRLLRWTESWVMWLLGDKRIGVYEHHHVYPHLLISHTDTVSFVQTVFPTSPTKSTAHVWQMGRSSGRQDPISRIAAYFWGKFTAGLTKQILKEDVSVFDLVQDGSAGASKDGILGRCEERLYSSQAYVRDQILAWQQQHSPGCHDIHCESHTRMSPPDEASNMQGPTHD